MQSQRKIETSKEEGKVTEEPDAEEQRGQKR